jgi:hypothetical protein
MLSIPALAIKLYDRWFVSATDRYLRTKVQVDALDLALTCWFSRFEDRDLDGALGMHMEQHHRIMIVSRALNDETEAAWGNYEIEENYKSLKLKTDGLGLYVGYEAIRDEHDLYAQASEIIEARRENARRLRKWHEIFEVRVNTSMARARRSQWLFDRFSPVNSDAAAAHEAADNLDRRRATPVGVRVQLHAGPD